MKTRLLIALSGGADSVCLLLKMRERYDVVAAHCNFALRGEESERDERFVRDLCSRLGIPLRVVRFDTKGEAARTGESIEMAARRLRYEWFASVCREEGCEAVAVAHHSEDNAETILLNLLRGTGIHGLTGMSRMSKNFGVKVFRPLLSLTRKDILDFLASRGETFVTDSTNTDTHYKRNKIRHELLPLLSAFNPQVVRTLNRTAHRLGEATEIFDWAVGKLKTEIVTPLSDKGEMVIDIEKLNASPAPPTLLHEILSPLGFTPTEEEETLRMRVGAWIAHGDFLLTRTATSISVRRVPKRVERTPFPLDKDTFTLPDGRSFVIRRTTPDHLTSIPRTAETAALDEDTLCGPLTLRSVMRGDRFQPFGMKGQKLVSDYLTDRKRSYPDKLTSLVLTDERGIVWLVGERTAEHTRITPQSRHILLITYLYKK